MSRACLMVGPISGAPGILLRRGGRLLGTDPDDTPASQRGSPSPRKSIRRSTPSSRRATSKGSSSGSSPQDREVYVKRREILKVLGLKPGMAVADIGAGSGLFTRLMAEEVGSGGKVYAVDVSKAFLDYIASQAKSKGQQQIVTIRGTQDSTNLPADSVDVVVPLRCLPSSGEVREDPGLDSQGSQSPWCPRAGRIRPGGGHEQPVRSQAHSRRAGRVPPGDRGRRVRARRELPATEAQGELRCEIPEEGRR